MTIAKPGMAIREIKIKKNDPRINIRPNSAIISPIV